MASQDPSLYIGIDMLANHRPFSYVALGADGRPVAMGQGRQGEVMAYLAGQRAARVGINGPLHPRGDTMTRDDVRRELVPAPAVGEWVDVRQCEYELSMRGLRATRTEANPADCPPWMRRGFGIVAFLDRLGYEPYPAEGSLQYAEVQADASFGSLLGRAPYEASTLEGRMQRQFILRQQGMPIHDPMDFLEEITPYKLLNGLLPMEQICTQYALNAWVAAYTVWLAHYKPRRVACLGAPEEGLLLLPLRED